MSNKRKVYISGPITGNMENYQTEFGKAAQAIINAGHIPLNPAMMPLGLDQRDYMRVSMAMMEGADLVLQLDGWDASEGAVAEYCYARKIGIPLQSLEDFTKENTNAPAPASEQETPLSRVERMFGARESWPNRSSNTQPHTQTDDYPEGYKGFLLIRCPECGEVRGFCSKTSVTETTCRNCGARIPLEDLIPAHVNCGKCGSHFKYRTNIDTQDPIPFRCLECEAPVDLQLNSKGTALTTIGDFRRGVHDDTPHFRNPKPWRLVR